ncbi:MAG: MBL fold metallo-hydrolase [Planctomycetota bacterium]
MLPKEPPRRPQLGFLYVPPFRVEGISIAGEESCVHLPEFDVAFDIGLCPRAALSSNYVALTHGHMDHAAALSYYFSQRSFQGMGTGKVICPKSLVMPIHRLMEAWVDIEGQRTPYELIGLEPGEEQEIKNNHVLRAFETVHTVPSLGYTLLEKRSKLKEEFAGLPQERLVELKKKGEEISQTLMIPLVCYTGDTAWGKHFDRDDVLNAKVLITECTFIEAGQRKRAGIGKHLHLDHILDLLERSTAESVILTHLSRRTHIGLVRRALDQQIPAEHRGRVHVLMDNRTNRERYERQAMEAEAQASE